MENKNIKKLAIDDMTNHFLKQIQYNERHSYKNMQNGLLHLEKCDTKEEIANCMKIYGVYVKKYLK